MKEGSTDSLDFVLEGEYIELIKLMKLLNLVESGAEAKHVVTEGLVECNSKVEYRKRRKLLPGDLVLYGKYQINIVNSHGK